MTRIACGIIAYNASEKIAKVLDSLIDKQGKPHVDVLVLGIDKKTTDDTKDIAEKWAKKKKIQLITHDFLLEDKENDPKGPKNFDRARNENWALFPKDCDWGFWIDSDDALYADVNLHQIAEEQAEDVSQVWFQYSYFRNEYGNTTTIFWRERLIRLKVAGKWVRRLHEICISVSGRHTRDERAWIEHENRTDESSKGERNFATLYAILKDSPNDQWATLYLGMQLFGAQRHIEAAQQFLKFVPMVDDIGERWQAYVYACKALHMGGQYDAAEQAALSAIREYPIWADPYYEMLAVYAKRADKERDGQKQYVYAQRAIQWYEEGNQHKPLDDPRLLKNPLDYDYNPITMVQGCYAIIGDLEQAKGLLDKAISIGPDPALVAARDQYQKVLVRRNAIRSGLDLAGYLAYRGEPLKAQDVLTALPVGSELDTDAVNKARTALGYELQFTQSDNAYENFYFLDQEEKDPDENDPTEEERWLLARLRRAGAKRVLDMGIGNGQTALYLAKNGISVVGMDIDPRRVRQANLQAIKRGYIPTRYSRDHGARIPVLEQHKKKCETTCTKCVFPEYVVQFWHAAAKEKIKNLGPYDAVIVDGLLNRVLDIDKTIQQAEQFSDRVIVTVPDAQDLGYAPKKGYLRSFNNYDVERLFVNRGAIVDSHRVGPLMGLQYVKGTPPHFKAVPDPTVAIFCGPGWERWTPDQINNKGLGGSETAVVHMAEEMVKRGLRVMVYAEAEGTWNGVHYRRYDKFNPNMPVWMFIAWRNPTLVDAPIQASLKFLWMHDTDCGQALTKERADKFDSILVLSKWHKDHMRHLYSLDADRFTVIGNGIDPDRFSLWFGFPDGEERANRILYSSSPDRGLEQVLTYWPEIRKRTEAELHVFYDFTNYDLMGGDPSFKKKIQDMAKADGVVWRGRIPQDQLAEEMMKAKVLFYPGPHPFNETYCITALEAQAAGCVPVTRDNGALPETNKHGIVLPNDSKPKRWFAAVQEALNMTETDRSKMREWALSQTWESVCNRVIERSIEIDAERQQQESQVV